jgi:hypothetical protein
VSEKSLGERFRAMVNSRAVQEIGGELKRMGVQGQAELASALFTGQGYVPYGVGQQNVDREGVQQQQKRGMSM